MHHTHPPKTSTVRRLAAAGCATALAACLWIAGDADAHTRATRDASPLVHVDGGALRGDHTDARDAFLGVPYAAAPVGRLRWRAPQPVAPWRGVRDATTAASSCPQTAGGAEDCLYLNVYAPTERAHRGARPVLVWIHGGGFSGGQGADYDPSQLAADGTVVVTINYRLGALGFLAHPALAEHRGGPSGNYGLMDQQAALRWVQRNVRAFGGDPHNVTVAGQSAGGLSVLAQLASPGARGLFQRAIVQSGSFALEQQPLRVAEANGKALAARAGCPDQSAECLRALPVASLLGQQGIAEIPGVVDGKVLRESVGSALAAGRFHRVPIVNGTNREEERVFLSLGLTISGGHAVVLPEAIEPASYQRVIASTFSVSAPIAARIAAEYPLSAYASPALAFSALDSDANFSCPALELDRSASRYVPTYAYEFNDVKAPERFAPPVPGLPTTATHQSELQYLFGLPTAPFGGTLSAEQERLGTAMRHAWARFAAAGAPPASWSAFDGRRETMLSLVTPEPRVQTDFSARHHCDFWARVR